MKIAAPYALLLGSLSVLAAHALVGVAQIAAPSIQATLDPPIPERGESELVITAGSETVVVWEPPAPSVRAVRKGESFTGVPTTPPIDIALPPLPRSPQRRPTAARHGPRPKITPLPVEEPTLDFPHLEVPTDDEMPATDVPLRVRLQSFPEVDAATPDVATELRIAMPSSVVDDLGDIRLGVPASGERPRLEPVDVDENESFTGMPRLAFPAESPSDASEAEPSDDAIAVSVPLTAKFGFGETRTPEAEEEESPLPVIQVPITPALRFAPATVEPVPDEEEPDDSAVVPETPLPATAPLRFAPIPLDTVQEDDIPEPLPAIPPLPTIRQEPLPSFGVPLSLATPRSERPQAILPLLENVLPTAPAEVQRARPVTLIPVHRLPRIINDE